MAVIVEFDIGNILGQLIQGDWSPHHTVYSSRGINQGFNETDADIRAGDRAKRCCSYNHSGIFFSHRIPGPGPGVIAGGSGARVGAHKTAVFAPHVNRMDIRVGGSVPVKYRNDVLLQLAVVILKGIFVGIQKGGKISVIPGANKFILSNAF